MQLRIYQDRVYAHETNINFAIREFCAKRFWNLCAPERKQETNRQFLSTGTVHCSQSDMKLDTEDRKLYKTSSQKFRAFSNKIWRIFTSQFAGKWRPVFVILRNSFNSSSESDGDISYFLSRSSHDAQLVSYRRYEIFTGEYLSTRRHIVTI